MPEKRIDSLTVGSVTYSNVVITGKTPTHLSFTHSRGFATLKITDINSNALYRVGYRPPTPAAAPPKKKIIELPAQVPKLAEPLPSKARIEKAEKDLRDQATAAYQKIDKKYVYASVALIVVLYLWFCSACKTICDKAGHPPGPLIWIPLLQMIPLFRAAGMSLLNFALLIVPLVGLVVYLVWCFKICQARNVPTWVGIFLFFPATMFPAILYLAHAGGANQTQPPMPSPVKIQL